LLAIFFTVYPIIDVPNPLIFGTKIAVVAFIANAIGAAIFAGARRKRSLVNRSAQQITSVIPSEARELT
jgi:hypothetical protein